jgi:hypothetical protein
MSKIGQYLILESILGEKFRVILTTLGQRNRLKTKSAKNY